MRTTISDQQLERLSDVLASHGHDRRTLDRARKVAADTDQRLDSALIQLGLVSERGLADAYASLLSLNVTRIDCYPSEAPVLPELLSAAFLRHARAIPIAADDSTIVLAAADPLDPFTVAAVAAATGRAVRLEVAVPIELEAALNRTYPEQEQRSEQPDEDTPLEEDAERLRDLASEAPVIRLVNLLITRAVETQASDIHIEPFDDELRVRYRYDGVLHEVEAPPRSLTAAITSRIKIMARLDIAERRMPQDGRIKLAVRGRDVDFRVSTIPSLHGETVVLRILDRSAIVFDAQKLGLAPSVIGKLKSSLALPNGIVLVTGPTGSGKTTTLYTGLLSLNATARKIVTVEDPIEYQLRGINQIEVRAQIGLTFASLLRAILRQDPDIIMLGEIRDEETAQIAVQAALTGHLVLSTLHTNSAAAAVTRLRDMGIEDYLLTATLRGVLAQRLIRRLCTECTRAELAAPELVDRFALDRRNEARPIMLSHAVGCAVCRQTGYRGRTAIAEFLDLTPEVERLIFARADQAAIEQASVANGMVSMFDSGVSAALRGETTLEEVTRSIRTEV